MNFICDVIFQVFWGYRNSEPQDQNNEISDPLSLSGTICEPISNAWNNVQYRYNTVLPKKEQVVSRSFSVNESVLKISYLKMLQ